MDMNGQIPACFNSKIMKCKIFLFKKNNAYYCFMLSPRIKLSEMHLVLCEGI